MALARTKTWLAGDVLTAADLNAEFNNILNNPFSLINTMPSAAGDLFISTGVNTWGRLAIGTSGQTLQVSTGLVPIWGAALTSGTVSQILTLKGSSTGVYTATTSVFSTAATSVAAGFGTSAVTLSNGNKLFLSIVTGTTAFVANDTNEHLQFASSLITFGPWLRSNNTVNPQGPYVYVDAHTVTSSETGAQTFNLQLRGDGAGAMLVFNGSTATAEGGEGRIHPRAVLQITV